MGRKDGNLTQNHLSLAQPSVKKTQLRVTMYSNRYRNTLLSRLFWILKVTWDVLIKGSKGEVGEGRVRFPETFNLLQNHLAVCNSKVASHSKKRGCLNRTHTGSHLHRPWRAVFSGLLSEWINSAGEVRLEERDQTGCLPKRSKNTRSRPWRPCRSASP